MLRTRGQGNLRFDLTVVDVDVLRDQERGLAELLCYCCSRPRQSLISDPILQSSMCSVVVVESEAEAPMCLMRFFFPLG